jgi:hypothetical protein
MKKLIFEFIAFVFCLSFLILIGLQKATDGMIFPFALMLMASGITFCNVVSTAYKLLSK